MAIVLSHLFSRLSGRIGDTRFWNNQYHPIIAGQLVVGVQPDTTDQVRWRTAFSNAMSLWSSLSESERRSWGRYGQSLRRSTRGNRLQYTGRDAFLQSLVKAWYCRSRGWLGTDPLGTPPSVPGYISFPSFEPAPLSVGQTGFRFRAKHLNSETCVILYNRSAEYSPTRNRLKSPWQITNNYIRTSSQFILLSKTGMSAGNVGFIRVRLLTSADPFRVSSTQYLRGVAVAY